MARHRERGHRQQRAEESGTGQLNGVLSFNNPLGLADTGLSAGDGAVTFRCHMMRGICRRCQSAVWLYPGGLHVFMGDYLSTIDNRGWRWRSTGDLRLTGWDCRMSCSVTGT